MNPPCLRPFLMIMPTFLAAAAVRWARVAVPDASNSRSLRLHVPDFQHQRFCPSLLLHQHHPEAEIGLFLHPVVSQIEHLVKY